MKNTREEEEKFNSDFLSERRRQWGRRRGEVEVEGEGREPT